MHSLFVDKLMTYDGRQLSSLWAYKNFAVQGDSIIAFRGPCDVKISEMVDLEDVQAGAFIYSEEMVHFIIEHFDMDLEKTITRQRLLMAIMRDILCGVGAPRQLRRVGDDLYLGERKASVSIATLTPVSSMIHTGVNISSRNTPVPAIGLEDMAIEPVIFAQKVMAAYCEEMENITKARCKVRGVG
ncbi:MAG TPA: DUF366 family protein [Negativicutes bacterium]|nr:DUF366 family protein [Negativicutes bacterium]